MEWVLSHVEGPPSGATCSCPAASNPGCLARLAASSQAAAETFCLLQNAGVEASMGWVLSHMEDSAFSTSCVPGVPCLR